MGAQVLESVRCYHCGQHCDEIVFSGDQSFCCVGCKSVFEILNENNLCEYYSIGKQAGLSQKKGDQASFAYLDDPEIRKKLLTFSSKDLEKVTFQIPSIHCVSCIWLLENLRKLNTGILRAEVS